MTWTVANLVIQLVAGILGGHAAAIAAKEHSFGWLGHSITGAVGGGLSGYFLQTLAATVVTASGSLNELKPAENAVIQALAGAGAGAAVTLVVGCSSTPSSTGRTRARAPALQMCPRASLGRSGASELSPILPM